MKKIGTKLTAIALAFILCVEMLPLNVFAQAESAEEPLLAASSQSAAPESTLSNETGNEAQPDVLYEVDELRGASEKHFRMSDGSYMAVQYDYPVHYENDEGVFQEIDNTLTRTINQSKEFYAATNGDTDVRFPATLEDGLLFEVSNNNYHIRLVAGTGLSSGEGRIDEDPPTLSTPVPENTTSPSIDESDPPEKDVEEDTGASETTTENENTEYTTAETTTENSTEESSTSEQSSESSEANMSAPPQADNSDDTANLASASEATVSINAILDGSTEESTESRSSEADTSEESPEPTPENQTEESTEPTTEETTETTVEETTEPTPEPLPEETSIPQESPSPAPISAGASAIEIAQNAAALTESDIAAFNHAEAVIVDENEINSLEEAEFGLYEQIRQEKAYSAVMYENVYDGIAFQYNLFGPHIKESIIINETQESYIYVFSLFLEGLTPELNENTGEILLKDEEEIAYIMPAPYMFDADGTTSTAVAYGLAPADTGHYILVVSASKEWINADERHFPVTIDPTLFNQTLKATSGYSGITVNHVTSGTRSYKATNHQDQVCGRGAMSSIQWCKMFLNINDLPTVPKNCVVTDAQIALYCKNLDTVASTTLTIGAQDVTSTKPSSHDTCGTWIGYMDYTEMEETIDLDSNVLDYHTMSSSDVYSYISWNVTRAALRWYENADDDLKPRAVGFIPTITDGTYVAAYFYGYSSSYGPRFIVTYRNTVGIEDYYTYQTASASRAGTVYVGEFTEQLTLVHSDLSLNTTTVNFSLAHIYNSANNSSHFTNNATAAINTKSFSSMKTGLGWKLSAQETIVEKTLSGINYLIYNDADGTEHYFMQSGTSSTYNDEDGLGLKIVTSTSGSDTIYTMTDTDAYNTKVFHNGYLISSTDSNGNAIYYAYNSNYNSSGTAWKPTTGTANQLVQIVEKTDLSTASLRTLATLSYNSDGTLSTITDYANRTTSFSYNSYGHLTQITHPDGTTASYTYTDTGYMTRATDSENGCGLSIAYSSNIQGGYTVGCVEEFAGSEYGNSFWINRLSPQKMSCRYYGIDGIPRTADDLVVYSVFDYWGRTVNSYTMDSYDEKLYGVSTATYTANKSTNSSNNRITSTGTSGVYSQNLLKDGGLEFHDTIAAWSSYGTGGSVAGSAAADSITITPHLGNKMIVISANSSESGGMKQSVSLTSETTYTFSAYVNTRALNSGSLQLAFLDSSGNTLKASDAITYQTSADIDHGWERVSVSYTPSSSGTFGVAVCVSGSGTACCDNMQLEVGSLATSVNLVQSGSFEDNNYSSSYWETSGSANTRSNETSRDGTYCLKTVGDFSAEHWYTQYINVNKTGEEATFILSGWAKACSTAYPEHESQNRRFSLGALFHYADGSTSSQWVDFSYAVTDWQYASKAIVPDEPTKVISSIEIFTAYYRNLNTAYFDDISLIMEPTQTYRYDAKGNLIAATDSKAKTAYEYFDGTSILKSYTDPAGVNYSMTYEDTTHNLRTTTSDGVTITNYYNEAGSSTQTSTKADSDTLYLHTWSEYNNDGSLYRTEAVNGEGYYYAYHTTLLIPRATKINGGPWSYTTYTTSTGRPAMSYISGKIALTYLYDDGLLSGLNRKTFYGSDTLWQRYAMPRDAFGNTTSISVHRGTDGTNWSSGRTLTSYNYILNTPLIDSMTYGNQTTVTYNYDVFERVTGRQYSDGTGFHYIYNANGDLGRQYMTDANGVQTRTYDFEYDSLDRLVRSRETGENGLLIQRTEHLYDSANRLTSQSWMFGDETSYTESYSYDTDDGKVTSVNTAAGATIAIGYDVLKRLETETTTLNGASTPLYTKTYDYRDSTATVGRTTLQVSELNYSIGGLSDANHSYHYSYDVMGNVTAISNSVTGYAQAEYTYDNRSQLTQEKYPEPSTNDWLELNYDYDTAGNLRSVTSNFYLGGEIVTGETVTHTYSYDDADWADLLTAYDGHSLTYDAIGNPLTYYNGSSYSMTWAKGRRLASVSRGSSSASYAYDMDGIRTSKTVNGVTTEFITQNGRVVRQSWSGNVLDFFYDSQQRPYAVTYKPADGAAATYYYITNLQGDVVALIDSSGSLAAEYTYNAWGASLTMPYGGAGAGAVWPPIAELNPLRYRGYYYDAETGFYYLQSRYYDPKIGRWINPEPNVYVGAFDDGSGITQYNVYAYCANNPVNFSDDTGEFAVAIAIGAAAGGIICAAISAVSQYVTTGEINWKVVGVNAVSGLISGAFAATSIGLPASIAINAALGGATYVAEQAVTGEDITFTGVAIGVTAGGISGVIGGQGADANGLHAAWDSASKGIDREMRRANAKYAAKQMTKYAAEKAAVKAAVKIAVVRYIAGVVASAYFSTTHDR